MDASIANVPEKSNVHIVPNSVLGRLLIAFATLVTPIIGFIFSYDSIFRPDWQRGVAAQFELMLTSEVNTFFYPLILYSVICMALILIQPERYLPFFAVRFGLYTGTFFVIHYFLLFIATGYILLILLYGLAALAGWYVVYTIFRWGINNRDRPVGLAVLLVGTIGLLITVISLTISYFSVSFIDGVIGDAGVMVLIGSWLAGFVLIGPIALMLCRRIWVEYDSPIVWSQLQKMGHWGVGGHLFGATQSSDMENEPDV